MAESTQRIPQLDGIRGAAILLVVVWHFVVGPITQAPHESHIARIIAHADLLTWSGVDLFFILSGFLIGDILIGAKKWRNCFCVKREPSERYASFMRRCLAGGFGMILGRPSMDSGDESRRQNA